LSKFTGKDYSKIYNLPDYGQPGQGAGTSAPTAAPAPAAGQAMEFRTIAEASAAERAGTLKKGTRVTIGGRSGTWN
jgi:hypothetical protein